MKNKLTKIFVILGLIIAITTGCYAFSFRNMTLDFVQISDTHITNRASTSYKALGNSRELLTVAVEQINNIVGLDFVLFTGDMVDSANDENFYNFYSILSKLKYPSLNTFGNHEFYGDMTKEQVLETVRKYNPNYVFDDTYYAFSPKTDYRIIVLDANIKDNKIAMGEIPQEQLEFLDKELYENQDKVVVIAMHHAVVEPFVAKEHSIVNAKEMTDILAKYNNPIVVLSGHYHTTKIRRIGNLVFVSTPSMVTYPMAFRHIKITNYKDRVVYNFDFIETKLEDIREQNRQNVISYGTLAGLEKDRNTQFIYNKKKHKSARYKRNKIKRVEKETKTSKKEIKKLTQPKKLKKQKKTKKVAKPQEV
ncbi:MAG: metallophosphoesterase [Candidatus Gastranaerophilales bacterium]|nr:metallophosphoesterase [Candidatus Gastranaerophilales bacterium]